MSDATNPSGMCQAHLEWCGTQCHYRSGAVPARVSPTVLSPSVSEIQLPSVRPDGEAWPPFLGHRAKCRELGEESIVSQPK